MMNFKKIGLFILLPILCLSTGCEVEGGKKSTASSSSTLSNNTLSTDNSSQSYVSSSNSSSSFISTGLPKESQEFIDVVNSIVLDVNAGEAISNAFGLWDLLVDWDYPEVLEAYDKLIAIEEEYNLLISNKEKIDLFLTKIYEIPTELTLDDEYLIVRAEDSYSKLSEELKAHPDVMLGYEILVEARTKYDEMAAEAKALKDAEDVAAFLNLINSIPNPEELSYSHFMLLNDALELYDLMSPEAKQFEGVAEAYQMIFEMQQKLNVKDGTGLFNIEIIHSGSAWEAVLNIQGISDDYKVSGTDRVHQLVISQNDTAITTAKLMSWQGSPATSYTKSNGTHSFSFTTGGYYTIGALFRMDFLIETDKEETYFVSFIYLYQDAYTYIGYDTDSLYKSMYKDQLEKYYNKLNKNDYSLENWETVNALIEEGFNEINDAINGEHAHIIYEQYRTEIDYIEKVYTKLEDLKVIEISSVEANMNTIVDNNLATSWQALEETNEYLVMDLGQETSVYGLSIVWEVANAKHYTIQISDDNENWVSADTIFTMTDGVSGNRTDEIRFENQPTGRYLRFNLIQGSTQWGFRIYEVDVLVKNN